MSRQFDLSAGIPIIGRPKPEDFPMMSESEIDECLQSLVRVYAEGQPAAVPIAVPLGAALRMAKTLAAQRFLLAAIREDIKPLIEGAPERPVSEKNSTALNTLLDTQTPSVAELAKYHA